MERVIANLVKTRRETLHGRDYIVAQSTLIVPGVLAGSQGRLLYPPEEVSKDTQQWNGMPIVVYHPQDAEGNFISARSPGVINDSGIGWVYNNTFSDKHEGEAWFDVALTRTYDEKLSASIRILPRLERGDPIELSTGLFTENTVAAEGSVFVGINGEQEYDAVARNYRPDHLAVLPDQKGACSNADGCGVNINEDNEGDSMKTKAKPMTKDAMVNYLATNCDCWKGDKDKEVLNALPEDKLVKLVDNNKRLLIVNAIVNKGVVNAEGDGETAGIDIAGLADFLGITTDPASDPVGFVKELQGKLGEILDKLGGPPTPPEPETLTSEEEEEDLALMSAETEKTPATNRKKANVKTPVKSQSEQQWLASAPPSVRSAVANAMKVERTEKVRLVRQLTANVEDDAVRQQQGQKLMAKSLDELQDLLLLMPPATNRGFGGEASPDFSGAAGGPQLLGGRDDSDNLLPVFNVDFEEMASPKLRQKTT